MNGLFLLAVEANPVELNPVEIAESPSAGYLLIRLALMTSIVLLLCAGLLLFSRWWIKKQQAQMVSDQLQSIDSIVLTARCTLHLIEVNDRKVVVGIDSNGIKEVIVLPSDFQGFLDR